MVGTRRRKAKRGFAAMSLEKRREIASKGGQAVKPENRAFAQNRELASEAGRKGGAQSPGKRRRRKVAARVVADRPAITAPAETVPVRAIDATHETARAAE
jgi:general stress protein YciG